MGIRRADHAKLERIHAKLRLDTKAVGQRFAHIAAFDSAFFINTEQTFINFEIGEFVIGGQHRMRLGRALYLRHFHDRFIAKTLLRGLRR